VLPNIRPELNNLTALARIYGWLNQTHSPIECAESSLLSVLSSACPINWSTRARNLFRLEQSILVPCWNQADVSAYQLTDLTSRVSN
jgi:hypothetical protein